MWWQHINQRTAFGALKSQYPEGNPEGLNQAMNN
jgi:hypothetical protein